MKVRTILITTVVAAGLTGGIGYGAYRAMKGQSRPVEVVPVNHVNQMYYGDEGSLYGMISSQVAQTVMLDDEYEIEDIFVEAGDTVEEGTPLFSYDMTLPELELEMEELTKQMYELDLTRMEKELEKLRGTRGTASLEPNRPVMTASDEEVIAEPESPGEAQDASGEEEPESSDEKKQEKTGLTIVGMEEVTEPEGSDETLKNGKDGAVANGRTEEEASSEEKQPGTEEDEKKPSAGSTEAETAAQFLGLAAQLKTVYGMDGEDGAEDVDVTQEQYTKLLERALALRDSMADCQDDGTYQLKKQFQEKLLEQWKQAALAGNGGSTAAKEDGSEADGTEKALREIYDGISTVNGCHVIYAVTVIDRLDEMDPSDERFEGRVRAAKKTWGSLNAAQKELEEVKAAKEALDQAQAELDREQLGSDMRNLVLQLELNILKLDELYQEHASSITAGDISGAVTLAADSFWGRFAEPDGDSFRLKDGMEELLGDESFARTLERCGEKLVGPDGYHFKYVKLLLDAWDGSASGAKEKAETLCREYDRMTGGAKAGFTAEDVQKLELARELTAQTEPSTEPGISESEPSTETDSENEPSTEPGSEEPSTDFSTEPETLTEETEGMGSESVEDLLAYISQFRSLASSTEEQETYLEDWRNAINLFQQTIGELPEEFAGEQINTMEKYRVKASVEENEALPSEGLAQEYKELCLKYVRTKILLLDPSLLDPANAEQYDAALAAYEEARDLCEELGTVWALEIPETYILDACDTILLINDIDESQEEDAIVASIQLAWGSYTMLPEEAKAYVWNLPILQELMEKYNVLPESESESEYDDWGGDWGGWGDPGGGYTAEELKDMIEELESEIKDCELDIRESEILVRQQQRIVDGKVVKSTLNGTVISIGSEDGSSDDEYFVKVASTEGLYAIGSMNELSLEKIQVGDVISGTSYDTGETFTGVIKEIAEYPSVGDSYSFGWGDENTNASYYEFKALIEDSEGIGEGEAEIQLTDTVEDYSNKIYLEKYFVRTESDGRTYVMKRGEDELLHKQYVQTGKTIYGYAIEITSGVTVEDRLAFPYGKDVFEGAQTKEVDQLTYS